MSETTATCRECGVGLRDSSRFCPGCGASTEPTTPSSCAGCGAELRPGAAFCAACGTAAGGASTTSLAAGVRDQGASRASRPIDVPGAAPGHTAAASNAAPTKGSSLDLAAIDWISALRTAGLAFSPLLVIGILTALVNSQITQGFDLGSAGSIVGGLTGGALWPLSGRFGYESASGAGTMAVLFARPLIVLAVMAGLLIWSFKRSLASHPRVRTVAEQAAAAGAIGLGAIFVLWLLASRASFVSALGSFRQSTSLVESWFFWVLIVVFSAFIASMFSADAMGPRWVTAREWFAPAGQAILVALAAASGLFLIAAVVTTLLDGGSDTLVLSLVLGLVLCLNGAMFFLSFGTFGGSQVSAETSSSAGSIEVNLLSGSLDFPGAGTEPMPAALWLIPVAAILVLLAAGVLMTLRHGQSPRNLRELGIYAGLWALVSLIAYPLAALAMEINVNALLSIVDGEVAIYPVSALAVITIPLVAVGLWFLSDWLLAQASPSTRLKLIRAAQRYPWPAG